MSDDYQWANPPDGRYEAVIHYSRVERDGTLYLILNILGTTDIVSDRLVLEHPNAWKQDLDRRRRDTLMAAVGAMDQDLDYEGRRVSVDLQNRLWRGKRYTNVVSYYRPLQQDWEAAEPPPVYADLKVELVDD